MKIAVLDDYQNVARSFADWSQLPDTAELTIFHDPIGDEDALAATLEAFDVVCAMRERTAFTADLIARLTNLKLLITTGMGNASIDIKAAHERGVLVCGTSSSGHAAAELTFAHIMALARGLVRESESVRNGGWQVGVGRDLKGATLGLVGLGRLGGQVAGFGQAFGMNVIAWSENLTGERALEVGAELVSKQDLFQRSDFVSILVRLSPRTRGLVGADEIALMKPDAYLVNTSRGPIVDTEALVSALQAGKIAGAGLDVFDQEPLPHASPLRQVPNLLLTPHVGYVSRENYNEFYPDTLEDVLAFIDGKPIRVIAP